MEDEALNEALKTTTSGGNRCGLQRQVRGGGSRAIAKSKADGGEGVLLRRKFFYCWLRWR
jgi:hypothetical protein